MGAQLREKRQLHDKSNYTMLYKYGKRTVNFSGVFVFILF